MLARAQYGDALTLVCRDLPVLFAFRVLGGLSTHAVFLPQTGTPGKFVPDLVTEKFLSNVGLLDNPCLGARQAPLQ